MKEEKYVICGDEIEIPQQYEKPTLEEITFDYLGLLKETKKGEMPVLCSRCHHCRGEY